MDEDEIVEYCLNVLLRVPGHSCVLCGIHGTDKCRQICKKVERMV